MINVRSMGASGAAALVRVPFLYVPVIEDAGTAIKTINNLGVDDFLLVNDTGRAWDNEPVFRLDRLYRVGNIVRPAAYNGYRYEVTAITTGISDVTTPPTYPLVVGDSVVNGGITLTCHALETGNGAIHGSGAESDGDDNPADYLHPNNAMHDQPGSPLFDLCNFWGNNGNSGRRLFVRFRCRTHAMFDQAEQRAGHSSYQMSGAVLSFGAVASDNPSWSLTINSDNLYAGLNYVDAAYSPNAGGYGNTGVAHRDLTGGLLTCDNGWHDVSIYFDARIGNLRSWVDGVEAVIDADNKQAVIDSIRGYASSQSPPYNFAETGNFTNGLTLMSRNASVMPGNRAASSLSTGATSSTANEFLFVGVNDDRRVGDLAIALSRCPRNYLPAVLSTMV